MAVIENQCIPPFIAGQKRDTNVDYLEKKLIAMDEQMAKLCRKLDALEREKRALVQALITVCQEFDRREEIPSFSL